jgi:hypothetical protein
MYVTFVLQAGKTCGTDERIEVGQFDAGMWLLEKDRGLCLEAITITAHGDEVLGLACIRFNLFSEHRNVAA